MNLKRRYLISFFSIFCLLATKHSHAQTRADIIGNWKVVKVEISPDADTKEKNAFETMNAMFQQAIFKINNDNSFTLIATNPDLAIPTATWSYNSSSKTITVTGVAPDTHTPGLLMEINVSIADGNYLFALSETPIVLTVSKN